MGKMFKLVVYSLILVCLLGCKKKASQEPVQVPVVSSFSFNSLTVNGLFSGFDYKGLPPLSTVKISFTSSVNPVSVAGAVALTDANGQTVPINCSFEHQDSMLVIQATSPLSFISKYSLSVSTGLKSAKGGSLLSAVSVNISTTIDSANKFAVIPDNDLLTLVQKQTFKYFWDFGHPVSGMARERNSSGEVVTTGGTGFGIMAMPVGVERNFIARNDAVTRLLTITDFLKNKAGHFHGAFSHWMNGTSGAVVPFGDKDNGADIVETSYMMMGLLTARQYFSGSGTNEVTLRANIDALWNNVEWDWFRKNGENVLYWNWSPDYGFAVNVPVQGWNECLITYVLAASSTTHSIPKIVYDNGFARNGAMKNNNSYYGYPLPLGQAFGGPLFFEQYSFMGINPTGLSDAYANYWTQAVNHSRINYEYCKANPNNYFGYSKVCWGLTASDIQNGYTASSPTNDMGVIAPTAAISSMPYTPVESQQALNFFYYKLGDKLWGSYGFADAFSLDSRWFANSYLAIDQGPQVVMIENFRTGLVWKLFMSCPEVKAGMRSLGFQSINL